jgi:tetratricopeptide (TPR) repeat protein
VPFEEDVAKWIAEGNTYFEKGNVDLPDGRKAYEVAEQFYDRVLRYDPFNESALSSMGILYVSTGRGPLAMKRLNRIRKDNPNALGPYRALSLILRISGKLEAAEHFFLDLLEDATEESRPFIYLSLAEIYAAQGRMTALRKHMQLLSNYGAVAPLTQGLLYMEEVNYQGIDNLAAKLPEGTEKDTLRGMSAEARNDWPTAGQYYFAAASCDQPSWISLNALASMWLSNNETGHCRTYLEKVEALAPNAPEVILTRARLYKAVDRRDKANKLKKHLLNLKGCFSRVRRMAEAL